MQMRVISVKVPAQLDQRLNALARRQRRTRSVLVREALEALTSRTLNPSVTSAAADLVGTLAGPKDLSTAAKHFAGYGE